MFDRLAKFKLSKEAQKKLLDRNKLKEEMANGKSAQEILGFEDETMATFFRAARHLFEHKRYLDSANAFMFLVTLNAYNYEYWLGLGMSLQMGHEYESAIDAYEMAATCNIDSPVPYFYLAKCLFAVHDRENALSALELALEYSKEGDEFKDLRNQALAAKKLLIKGL